MHGETIQTFEQTVNSEFSWDGRDNNGRDLPPGVYLCLFQDGSRKIANGTIVLAR
jgi:flagellar hook assembly protein FlgD